MVRSKDKHKPRVLKMCPEQGPRGMCMAAADAVKPGRRKWFRCTVLLAFGLLEFKLPGDTQKNVGSGSSSEIDFGLNLCGGDRGSHRSQRIRF